MVIVLSAWIDFNHHFGGFYNRHSCTPGVFRLGISTSFTKNTFSFSLHRTLLILVQKRLPA